MEREEAINIVRNICQTDAEKKALQTLIPELAESEDERNWKTIERAIRGFITNPIEADELLAWLEKQKEQKPAEWSEEEDKFLQIAIHYTYGHGYLSVSNWLKSLKPQPHWKPSKEQMEALENVIKCELSAGLHTRAGILESLYNNLKKLM